MIIHALSTASTTTTTTGVCAQACPNFCGVLRRTLAGGPWLTATLAAPLGGGGNAACARGDTSSRPCVQPWQRPCITVVMCTRRSSDVRPQERVQRHTVEHLTDLVRFAPMVQVLDAPVPLMAEQLVDVLALLEKQEKEEEARMDRLENMILEGKSVSAADKEAWRRWARAGGTKRNRKKRRKRKLPRCPRPQASLRHAARVPSVQGRDHGRASVPVHRQSVLAIPVVTQRRGTHSANRADLRRVSTGAVLGQGCALLCGATAGFWSRQCRKPWNFHRGAVHGHGCCLPVVVQDRSLVCSIAENRRSAAVAVGGRGRRHPCCDAEATPGLGVLCCEHAATSSSSLGCAKCAENHAVSTVARWRDLILSSIFEDFFEPSSAHSCECSRARVGGDAVSLTPRCSAHVQLVVQLSLQVSVLCGVDRHIVQCRLQQQQQQQQHSVAILAQAISCSTRHSVCRLS